MGAQLGRREFLGRVGTLAAGAAAGWSGQAAGQAEPQKSRVCLSRAGKFRLVTGYMDPRVIERLLDEAMTSLTGEASPPAAWRKYLHPSDRVAIQVAVTPAAAALEVVDGVIGRMVQAGLSPDNVVVFAADERDLFAAGYSLRSDGRGVQCFGAASEGYRGGLTRVLLDRATALVNLCALAPHAEVGLAGAIENYLNCIPPEEAGAYLADGGRRLGEICARPLVHDRTRLHIMDCMQATYALPADGGPSSRWPYGGIMIAEDPVALDTIAAALLNAQRAQSQGTQGPLEPAPAYLEACDTQLGLGHSERAMIELLKSGEQEGVLL